MAEPQVNLPHCGKEAPLHPQFGDIWYDTIEKKLWMYREGWTDVLREAETIEVGTWEENVEYLLSRCKYTIRVREGGGQENLISSLIVTFMKMEIVIAKLLKGDTP